MVRPSSLWRQEALQWLDEADSGLMPWRVSSWGSYLGLKGQPHLYCTLYPSAKGEGEQEEGSGVRWHGLEQCLAVSNLYAVWLS